jgi:hypothetical protein
LSPIRHWSETVHKARIGPFPTKVGFTKPNQIKCRAKKPKKKNKLLWTLMLVRDFDHTNYLPISFRSHALLVPEWGVGVCSRRMYVCHSGGGAYPSYLCNNMDKEVENGLALQRNSHYPQKYLFITTNAAPP